VKSRKYLIFSTSFELTEFLFNFNAFDLTHAGVVTLHIELCLPQRASLAFVNTDVVAS
jgi:hypothetical protein